MYQYANKQLRDQLAIKSLLVYNRRGKWKKVMKQRGLSIEQIEDVMDQMIKIMRGTDAREETRSAEAGHESNPQQSDSRPSEGDDVREE